MPFFDPLTGEYVDDPGLGASGETDPSLPEQYALLSGQSGPSVPDAWRGAEARLAADTDPGPVLTPPEAPVLPAVPEEDPPGAGAGFDLSTTRFRPERGAEVEDFVVGATGRRARNYAEEFAARRAAAGESEAAAREIEKHGLRGVSRATVDALAEEQRGHLAVGKLREEMQRAEVRAAENAGAAVALAKADWTTQIQRVASMRIDPDKLVRDSGPGTRLGLGLAAFAEGFLGAKGIKVNAVAAIQQRIQENIDSQLEDIRNGRETSGQFRALYEAARSQAVDDQNLRDRANRLALEVVSDGVKANLAGARSELEIANNMKLLGDIDAESLRLDQRITEAFHAEGRRRHEFDAGQAADWARIAVQRDALAWDTSPFNPRNRVEVDPEIHLVSTIGDQPVPIAVKRAGISDGHFNQVQEKIAHAGEMVRLARELRDDFEAAGVRIYNGPFANFINSPENAAIKAKYERYFIQVRRDATGQQASVGEDVNIRKGQPFPEYTGASAKTVADVFNQRVGEDLRGIDAKVKSVADFNRPVHKFAPDWDAEQKAYNPWADPETKAEKIAKGAAAPITDTERMYLAGRRTPHRGATPLREEVFLRRQAGRDAAVAKLERQAVLGGIEGRDARSMLNVLAQDKSLTPATTAAAREALARVDDLAAKGEVRYDQPPEGPGITLPAAPGLE